MTNQTPVVLQDIEAALQAVESILPTALTVVGTFVPQVAAVSKFLPLIQVLLQGVNVVAQATGDASTASATVAQHLTPGQPNAPQLS